MENLVFKEDIILNVEDILYLYNDVGWSSYTKNIDSLIKSIKNSFYFSFNKRYILKIVPKIHREIDIMDSQSILFFHMNNEKNIIRINMTNNIIMLILTMVLFKGFLLVLIIISFIDFIFSMN